MENGTAIGLRKKSSRLAIASGIKTDVKKWIIPSIILLLGVAFVLIPFLWILITSFKMQDDIFTFPLKYIPSKITLQNYIDAWQNKPLPRWYFNTTVVSVSSTILAMLLSIFAGYGFSRFHIKGKGVLLIALLISQMFPQALIVIPYFVWMSKFHLINTYMGLIISYLGGSLPFCIWMLKGYFDTVPKELEQAAMIDGCNELSAFFKVILPLSAPGVSAATLFTFLVAWNNYLLSLILVTKDEMFTLNVGLTSFIGEMGVQWGPLNAVALMTSVPIILVFVFLEKYMVAGMTSGAIKG